jgi:2-oxoisovalerate dehydrogenase E1 component beta subunit
MFDLDAPVVRIGGPDIPAMPYAAALEHFYTEPTPDHLYRAMRDLAGF